MNPPPPLLSPQLLPATAAAPAIFQDYSPPSLSESLPSLKPNLAIILVGLGFTFMFVCAFALFAKCMNPHFQRRREQQMAWLESDGSVRGGGGGGGGAMGPGGHKDGAGVDPAVIAALPLILYKPRRAAALGGGGVPSLKRSGSTGAELLDKALALGGAGGSTGKAAAAAMRYQELEVECAVCLSAFEEGEQLRQLPECRHAFHPACVDSWLGTHPSCPLCRRSILPKAADKPDKAVFVPQESQRLRLGELSDALAPPQSTAAALPPRSPPPPPWSPSPAASASSSSRVDAAAPAVVVVPEIVVMGGDLPWPLPTRSPARSPVAPVLPAGPSPGFVAVPVEEPPVVERAGAGAGAGGGTNSGLPPPA